MKISKKALTTVLAVGAAALAFLGCGDILGLIDPEDQVDASNGADGAFGDATAADAAYSDHVTMPMGSADGSSNDGANSNESGDASDSGASVVCSTIDASGDDSQNCGACGRSCLGASCEAGVCGATTIAVGEAVAMLATNDTNVFWTGGGAIRVAPVLGGKAAQTITNTGLPNGGFVLDSTRLYYSDRSNAWVESVGLMGGPVTVIARGGYPTGVAIDATNVYWVNGSRGTDGTVLFAPKTTADGGADQPISNETGPAYPVRAAVSNGYIYWLALDDSGDTATHYVRRAPLGVGLSALQPVVTATGIRGFAVDSQYVYYTVPLGYIARVNLDGSDFTILINDTNPNEVSVSSDEIFWSTLDGKMMKARKSDGSGQVTLYSNPNAAQAPAFTVGTQYVFLTSTGSEVLGVPR